MVNVALLCPYFSHMLMIPSSHVTCWSNHQNMAPDHSGLDYEYILSPENWEPPIGSGHNGPTYYTGPFVSCTFFICGWCVRRMCELESRYVSVEVRVLEGCTHVPRPGREQTFQTSVLEQHSVTGEYQAIFQQPWQCQTQVVQRLVPPFWFRTVPTRCSGYCASLQLVPCFINSW